MDLILQIYLGLTVTLSVFALITAILAIAYSRLFKKYTSLKQEQLDKEAEINKKTAEILEKAESDYTKITSDANQRAREIIAKAKLVKKNTEKSLLQTFKELDKEQKKMIKKTTHDIFKKYHLNIKDENIDNINIQNNISKDIETYSKNRIEEYKNSTLRETAMSQNALEEKIEEEYETIENKLKNQKAKKLKEIDNNIHEIIRETAKATLGKIISTKDHKDLIIEALEKAKKERKI